MIQHLYSIEPAYDRLRPARAGMLPVGTVIVGDLTGDAADRPTAVLDAVALQRESPWCPLCFVSDGAAPSPELLDALAEVPREPAWVVGAVAPRPMTEDVAEAVRSRSQPGADDVVRYVAERLGGSNELAHTAFRDTFADALDELGDPDVDAARLDGGALAQDVLGWEPVVEILLRRRGYVRDPEGTSPEVTIGNV